jgi:hypothetical protein
MKGQLKGQDVLVLVALLAGVREPPPTMAELADRLGLSLSGIHRSLAALQRAQLVDKSRHPQLAQVDEFLSTALRYVFPPLQHGEVRGLPTAWAASPLRDQLAESANFPLVWAHPQGRLRGVEFEPLHPAVPEIAFRDPQLGEWLALIDALRLNDARVRELARRELRARFSGDHLKA